MPAHRPAGRQGIVPPPIRYIFDGQSLMTQPAGASAPIRVDRRMGRYPSVHQVAISSTTYAEREATAATRYAGLLGTSQRAIIVDLGAQTDLWSGMTAGQVYTAATDYYAARRSEGADGIAVLTVPTSVTFALNPGTYNIERLAFNDLLRNSGLVDVVIDLAADPRFQNSGDGLYFDGDATHPSALGADTMASLIVPALVSRWGY